MVVVVAADWSDRSVHVVSEAVSLAAVFDEAVYVVHALTRSELTNLGLTSVQVEESKDMDEIRSTAVEMAEDFVSGLDVPYETVGLAGNPADKVIKYVDGQDASYIAVNPRRRSRTGKALLGSVAQSTLLNASCPVALTFADEE